MEKYQSWLLLLPSQLLSMTWRPYIERQTILALWSASTASESVDDTLGLGRKSREVDWFGSTLRTVAIRNLVSGTRYELCSAFVR